MAGKMTGRVAQPFGLHAPMMASFPKSFHRHCADGHLPAQTGQAGQDEQDEQNIVFWLRCAGF